MTGRPLYRRIAGLERYHKDVTRKVIALGLLRKDEQSKANLDDMDFFRERFEKLQENVASVVVTSPRNLRFALLGLFAQGHVLLEDLPGVGKTLLAKTIAQSIDGVF